MKWFPVLALIAILLALYGATLSRTIYLEDSAEFVAASHTLSIPHPSGYPTYLVTTKLISLVPFFPTIASRINFVSALWTIASVVLLYNVLLMLFKSRLIGFSLALLFAISPMVWQQATYAEVYSLNTFFFVLLIWSAIYYYKRKSDKRLYLFFFLYGLSLTNHFLPLTLAPLILAWLLYQYPLKKNVLLYAKAFLAWLVGLAPYIYIPIRNQTNPAFSWFGGDSVQILKYNIAYGHKISQHTISYFADVVSQLTQSFGAIGVIAFLAGIGVMIYYKHPARYYLFGALLLVSVALVIVLTNGRPYGLFESQFYQTLYVPFLLLALFPIGFLLQKMLQSKYSLIIFYTSVLALLIWPATNIGNRFLNNDRSEYVFMENYTRKLIESVPANSPLYVHHDHIMNDSLVFGLAYQKYVAQLGAGVSIYSLTPVFPPPNDFSLDGNRKQNYAPALGKYLDEKFEPDDISTTFPRPSNGLLAIAPNNYAADNLYLPSVNNNLYHQSLLAKYYYDLAQQSYAKGNIMSGQRFLVRAIEYDPDQFSNYYYQTLAIRNFYFDD